MSKVKVNASESGAVIIVSENNSNYGHVKLTQDRVIFENGWAKQKSIIAFVPGAVEDLKKLNWSADQELDGKIIEVESMKPFNKKEPERDYKIAGKTGIVCVVDGKPIYRKTQYTTSLTAVDEKIVHTNKADIKAAFDLLKAKELETATEASADPAETFQL